MGPATHFQPLERFEDRIETALALVRQNQLDLMNDFRKLSTENAEQHGEVGARIAGLEQDVKAIRERLTEILAIKIGEATEKITARNWAIRILAAALFGAICILAGAKAHAVGWIKDFWF